MNNKFIIKDNTQLKEPKLIGSILTSKNIPASENAIYDMHMHSTCSNEEDYKMPTPEEYIERAYEVAQKNNCKVKLSITDHQSIEGSKRAIKYLKEHPQYADYVEIVSGIEINTSLGSVNNELGVSKKNGFAGCHILGYNYNLLDPELSAFSYLNYAETENSKYLGLKLIAARNYLKEKYNYSISFVELEKFYNENCNLSDDEICANMAYKFKCEHKEITDSYRSIKAYMLGQMDINEYDPNAINKLKGKCRLDLVETCEMIKNAGGKVVLAHPCNVYCGDKSLSREEFIDVLLAAMQKVTNKSIDGLEVFNNVQFINDELGLYLKMIEKYDLFATCGSDCHGPKISLNRPYDDFMRVVAFKFQEQLKISKNEDIVEYIKTFVTALPIWDNMTKGIEPKNKSSYEIVNTNLGKLDEETILAVEKIANFEVIKARQNKIENEQIKDN